MSADAPDGRAPRDAPAPPRGRWDAFLSPFTQGPSNPRNGVIVAGVLIATTIAVCVPLGLEAKAHVDDDLTWLGLLAGALAVLASVWIARSFAVDRAERTLEATRSEDLTEEEKQGVVATLRAKRIHPEDVRPEVPLVVPGVDLREARLENALLRGAVLDDARLERARLSGADLRDASLRGARLDEALLRATKLDRADLSGARLAAADLRGAELEGAKLVGADLRRAVFAEAKLPGADLSKALLAGADFTGADLTEAQLPDPLPPDVKGIPRPKGPGDGAAAR